MTVEFFDYICVFILFKTGLTEKKKFLFTLPLPVTALIAERFLPEVLASFVRPTVLFYIGVAFFVYRDKIKLKLSFALISFFVLSLFIFLKLPDIGIYLGLPYLLFYLCFGIKQLPERVGNLGNISYCIYLWGFPVGQATVFFLGLTLPIINFCVTAFFTLIIAFLTYLAAEKPFLKK